MKDNAKKINGNKKINTLSNLRKLEGPTKLIHDIIPILKKYDLY